MTAFKSTINIAYLIILYGNVTI